PGTLTNAAGQTLNLRRSTISAPFLNQGTLLVEGDSRLGGSVTTTSESVVRIRSEGFSFGTAVLRFSQGFTNAGLIELRSTDRTCDNRSLPLHSAPLPNAPSAPPRSAPGSGGALSLTAQLDNQGTLAVQQSLAVSNSGRPLTSTAGTVTVSAGAVLTID